MKQAIFILDIIFLFLFLILMIDTMILVKKSEDKLIEEIRDRLLKRIHISTILMIVIGILTIIRIIMG